MLFDILGTNKEPETARTDDILLNILSFTLHTSFSDHLGAGGAQLTLLPLSPYA